MKTEEPKPEFQARIDRVEVGNLGDIAPVGEGFSELRIFYGPGYRVYLVEINSVIILLSGGDKSSQQSDIAKAKDIAKQLEDE